MAGRAIPYVGKLVSNLIKLLPCDFEDLKCFWGLEEELSELRESLDSLANLVEDADEKQERWWLIDVRDVAYLADDVLSELSYEATRLKIQTKEVLIISFMSFNDSFYSPFHS
ncbi:hypothetical protein M5689_002263 [Euphorbia peplus]|nr:hypothetical protein M5689_002263 [Euphorbia peplus]